MTGSLRIGIRVDGDSAIGLGHLVRSLALAEALTSLGAKATLFSRPSPVVATKAWEAGVSVLFSRAQNEDAFLRDCLVRWHADGVVLDTKAPYGGVEIRALNGRTCVVVMDNACEGMFEASLTIFPVAHLDEAVAAHPRWGMGGILLKGQDYVVVADHIRALGRAEARERRSAGQGLLITMGGADPADMTERLLTWLAPLPLECRLVVLVGEAFARKESLRILAGDLGRPVTLLQGSSALGSIKSEIALALCAFGVSAYEMACLGIPTLLVSHTEGHTRDAARFAQLGSALDLGWIERVDGRRLAETVSRVLGDADLRARLGRAGRALVDG
ncbi:MAG: hypothetical protein KGJ14_02115, partial [Nitrospirota bacterium]|nr:hypothetical protein [Nitrospirota bacterium]